MGTLPVLELDDGTCISESLAICRFFEETHPDPPLLVETPREKAEIEMWVRRAELYLYLPIDLGVHFARSESSRGAAEEFASWADLSVRFLDSVFASQEFITGARLTRADIFAFGALGYGIRFAGFSIPRELEHLHAWYSSMSSRLSASA